MTMGHVGAVASAQTGPETPQIPGVVDLWTLVRALDNKKEIDAFLKSWSEIIAGYDSKIKAMGGVEKINTLRTEAERALAAVQKRVADSDGMIDEAEKEAGIILAGARAEAQALNEQAAANIKAGADAQTALAVEKQDFSRSRLQTENGIAAREKAVTDKEAELVSREAAIAEKEARFRAALGT